MVLDATIPFEKQDLQIAISSSRRAARWSSRLNKWDLVADKPGLLKDLSEDSRAAAAAGQGRARGAALGSLRARASTR